MRKITVNKDGKFCHQLARRHSYCNIVLYTQFFFKGQWGLPNVTIAGVLGMFAAIIANIIQSLGNYYALARMTKTVVPPPHAVNRGIGMEGIGSILAAAWGTANATSTYSANVVLVGLTKVKI